MAARDGRGWSGRVRRVGGVCGLAGVWDPRGRTAEELGHLAAAMAATLAHRGPDDEGVFVDGPAGLALGHRRLAVVGLGPDGHQPMVSASGRLVCAYNGEVYNHRELRRRLAAEGVAFRGASDTEVLLAAAETWGIETALERVEGMLALALWDRGTRRLVLARDRFGEKPLYYGMLGGALVFASELKALRVHPGFPGGPRGPVDPSVLDPVALRAYFRLGQVPAPRTIYAGVTKLGPGSLVSVDEAGLRRRELVPQRWWSPVERAVAGAGNRLAGSPEQLADRVEEALARSVATRLVADVPVGALLSGGIDSTLVVALAQVQAREALRTFTVGFAEAAYDESAWAAKVAAHLGTDHTQLVVSPAEVAAVVPTLGHLYDEPFADASQLPTHLVSALARRHVTVALSGDGGDELFGGYNRHRYGPSVWASASRLPAVLRWLAAHGLSALPPQALDRLAAGLEGHLPGVRAGGLLPRNPGTKLAKLARVLDAESPDELYRRLVERPGPAGPGTGGKGPWHRGLAGPGLGGSDGSGPSHPMAAGVGGGLPAPELESLAERMMLADLLGYLPDDILTKVDRASMGVSLEVRAPFLDSAVAELAWRLPPGEKVAGRQGKVVLRRVLARHVPASLTERPKMGFGVPLGDWFRGPLRGWAEEVLSESPGWEDVVAAAGGAAPSQAAIEASWVRQRAGRADHTAELWDVLVLRSWLAGGGA